MTSVTIFVSCVTLRPVTVVQGTTFSAMLGDMLEAVRWPQDPAPAPGSPFSRAGSKGGKPESPTATRVRVPVGQIGTSTLAAHPTRQLFLTGHSSASHTSMTPALPYTALEALPSISGLCFDVACSKRQLRTFGAFLHDFVCCFSLY